MKIIVTGGHPTPALAIIDELSKNPHIHIHFVGKKYHYHPDEETFEYSEITKRKINFTHFDSGRLTRLFNPLIIWEAFKLVWAFIKALMLLRKIKPDCIVSFGGYIALPIALAAYVLEVSVFTHEQTISPGLANKLIAKIAQRVFISFPQAAKHFNANKTEYVGLPLRKQVFTQGKALINRNSKPMVVVLGGSLGSHSVNVHIETIIQSLLTRFQVVHQIGNVSDYGDYERLKNLNVDGYYPYKHISDEHIGWVLNQADVVVSRSGANTVMEIIALKKPSVLVPLPWSANDEQLKQAKLLKSAGVAEIFNQGDDSSKLEHMINQVYDGRKEYIQLFDSIYNEMHKPNAAASMVECILADMNSSEKNPS